MKAASAQWQKCLSYVVFNKLLTVYDRSEDSHPLKVWITDRAVQYKASKTVKKYILRRR